MVWEDLSLFPGPVKSVTESQRFASVAMFLQSCCVGQALSRRDGPATRYMLRGNTSSIMKV